MKNLAEMLKSSAYIVCVILISAALSVAFAKPPVKVESESTKITRVFACDGFDVTLDIREHSPIIASILLEDGTWVEVPTNDRSNDDDRLFLYNILNNKIAVMGATLDKTGVFLQIYRDFDFYKAHQPQHSLRCRRI